jgi:hypothetical protein
VIAQKAVGAMIIVAIIYFTELIKIITDLHDEKMKLREHAKLG